MTPELAGYRGDWQNSAWLQLDSTRATSFSFEEGRLQGIAIRVMPRSIWGESEIDTPESAGVLYNKIISGHRTCYELRLENAWILRYWICNDEGMQQAPWSLKAHQIISNRRSKRVELQLNWRVQKSSRYDEHIGQNMNHKSLIVSWPVWNIWWENWIHFVDSPFRN